VSFTASCPRAARRSVRAAAALALADEAQLAHAAGAAALGHLAADLALPLDELLEREAIALQRVVQAQPPAAYRRHHARLAAAHPADVGMLRQILGADRVAAGADHARDTHRVQSLCHEKFLRHWNDGTHDAAPPIW